MGRKRREEQMGRKEVGEADACLKMEGTISNEMTCLVRDLGFYW